MITETLRTNGPDSLIGRRLSKGYIVQKELGRGGMGVVYLGYAEGLQREVAIKVIRQRGGRFYEQLRERFEQEAQVVAGLQHPGIVVVHDLGVESDGLLYMVMERLVGQPLHRLIHEEGNLMAEEAIRLMLPLLSALEAAHRRGVIHRDIKPANIMVCQTDDGMEQLKVLDFGLARPTREAVRDPFTTMPLAEYTTSQPAPPQPVSSDGTVGTPQYMAPEQARFGHATPQVDVYSAGIVLLEMLTGAAPATPMWRTPERHPTVWPPEAMLRNIEPPLRRIIRSACAIEPAERLTSAAQLRAALAELLDDAPAPRVIVRRQRAEDEIFGARYRVINALDAGGMGELFRIEDLLTGQILLLKRVHSKLSARSSGHRFTLQLALEREFRTLSSLRHPNIVDVLDYGFDDHGRAFFTMPLHERSRDIISACRGRSLGVKLAYLGQLLRALDYVHSRGILHRDLKPANIIVAGEQVKVLDFGLASGIDEASHQNGTSGTAAYTAPELLQGQPPSKRSDLFAVGLIAAEMLLESYPYPFTQPGELISLLLSGPPALEQIPEPLRPLIARLLATAPHHRPESAREVLSALSEATGTPMVLETDTTRESYLQAATLSGRSEELARLQQALDDALRDQGSLWLIGGESGVGKSRLLAELRAIALIRGAAVVVCQAEEGERPYHTWAPLARWLSLTTALSSEERRILTDVAPDLALRSPALSAPPSLAPDDARLRVFSVLAAALGRLSRPLMVVLEDLHWAGPESLDLLAFLCADVEELPLLLAATVRSEAAPELPEHFPSARMLTLERLTPSAMGELLSSVFHTSRIPEAFIQQLHDHTEGNPFFLVEMLREAADRLGGLSAVLAQSALPTSLEVPSIQRLLLSRIESAGDIRPILEQAAVLGRRLDEGLLQATGLTSEALSEALRIAAGLALVEVHQGHWRFCHDRIRETLRSNIAPERLVALHRRSAEAITASDTPDPAALALHWRGAAEPELERACAWEAGNIALSAGASDAAVAHFLRVDALTEGTDPLLDALLGRALLLTGQSAAGQARIFAALSAVDRFVPDTSGRLRLGLLSEVVRLLLPGAGPTIDPELLTAISEAMNTLLFDLYANDAPGHVQFYHALRTLNLPATPQTSGPHLRINAGMAFALRAGGAEGLARWFDARAARLLPAVTSPRLHGELGIMRLYEDLHRGDWTAAERTAQAALERFAEAGLERGRCEIMMGIGFACYYQGRIREALATMEDVHRSAIRRQDPLQTFYAASGILNYQRLLGQQQTIAPPEALDGLLWFARAAWDTIQAEILRGQGETAEALRLARSAAAVFLSRAESLAYIKECQTQLASTLLWLLEDNPALPERAELLSLMKRLTRSRQGSLKGMPVFTVGVLRHQAAVLTLTGKSRRAAALLKTALAEAARQSQRLEEALVRFDLARLDSTDPAQSARHLAAAVAILEDIGAQPLLARIRRYQDTGRTG